MTETQRKRITSPEDLNQFIRVSSPVLWLVLVLLIALLILALAWGVVSTVDEVDAAGNVRTVHPIIYVIS